MNQSVHVLMNQSVHVLMNHCVHVLMNHHRTTTITPPQDYERLEGQLEAANKRVAAAARVGKRSHTLPPTPIRLPCRQTGRMVPIDASGGEVNGATNHAITHSHACSPLLTGMCVCCVCVCVPLLRAQEAPSLSRADEDYQLSVLKVQDGRQSLSFFCYHFMLEPIIMKSYKRVVCVCVYVT
jgi:hypothetical protein